MAHSDTTSRYVARVRGLLRTELSEEELEMLLADLEDQLAPLDESEIEGRRGSPEEFVDTYLASAGIDTPKLVGFIIGSMLLSRLTKYLPGRLLNILTSGFAAYVALVAAVNT